MMRDPYFAELDYDVWPAPPPGEPVCYSFTVNASVSRITEFFTEQGTIYGHWRPSTSFLPWKGMVEFDIFLELPGADVIHARSEPNLHLGMWHLNSKRVHAYLYAWTRLQLMVASYYLSRLESIAPGIKEELYGTMREFYNHPLVPFGAG